MTMDGRTIKATQGAWLKWDKIARGEATHRGATDCPLCALFIRKGCDGCPIKAATNMRSCGGTPLSAYVHLSAYEGAHNPITLEAAYAFRNFINLLLPPEHRMPKRRATP